MRLATITNWAYGATVALTLASGTTMLLASAAQQQERISVSERYVLDRATSAIEQDVLALSALARQYGINGDASDLVAYGRLRADLGTVEVRTRRMKDAGAGEDELRSLREALEWVDALQVQQQQAITARKEGRTDAALRILFGPEYERGLDRSRAAVERFQYRLDQRTADNVRASEKASRAWRSTSEAMLAVTGILFLCVLFFVFRRRVLHPVVKLSDVISRLAAQDYDAEPPHCDQIDEIGDMAQALRVFRENGIERQRLERERDADRAVRDLLSRMTQRMQGCDTIHELTDVVRRFAPEVAPELAGTLYFFDANRNVLVEGCSWLEPTHSAAEFSPLACWGLRRSVPHRLSGRDFDLPCQHLAEGTVTDSLCLPLVGQQGTLGLLYLESRAADTASPMNEPYLELLAENVGLAVDNLRLRDALRSLAMVDPLTTLPNRRQLDEVLARELASAERAGTSICCVMIDVDHFKRFNDEHGHDAGDAVLRAVGQALQQAVRESGLVFRYGGEEFLMLLPGLEEEPAAVRAEEIRRSIAALRVQHDGHALGAVTISVGLACAPAHIHWQGLLQTADAALLRAKQGGRNQVIAASKRRSRSA